MPGGAERRSSTQREDGWPRSCAQGTYDAPIVNQSLSFIIKSVGIVVIT